MWLTRELTYLFIKESHVHGKSGVTEKSNTYSFFFFLRVYIKSRHTGDTVTYPSWSSFRLRIPTPLRKCTVVSDLLGARQERTTTIRRYIRRPSQNFTMHLTCVSPGFGAAKSAYLCAAPRIVSKWSGECPKTPTPTRLSKGAPHRITTFPRCAYTQLAASCCVLCAQRAPIGARD